MTITNPITLRRLQNFRKSRRGYVSFWIFLTLLILALPAEFIANDKPIAVSYQGEVFFPLFKKYKETEFGGTFETEADYTDPYIIQKIKTDGWIIKPIIPFDHQTVSWDLTMPAPSAPDSIHILGTDDQSRDVLARVILRLPNIRYFRFYINDHQRRYWGLRGCTSRLFWGMGRPYRTTLH